ncbi:MAG: nucleotidyltransferase [Candidatus Kapabacteria bacterium]|nr:nucleotidyltransferase [Ignavibacteriota bacterium]MCW5884110.1 nucleotidyltransferase [Candidatus Kapabacteria bacterium]
MNKAVIMAGGFGTRLRPLTMQIPKPMVPILNVPMMGHIVNLLKKHNITDILSLLYFQPDSITSHFENGEEFGINMSYVLAQADYGTAGAVKNAYLHLSERCIIISGDVLTDFDLSKAIKFHEEKGSMATLLLTRVASPIEYGIVITDDDGKIVRFLEKPSWGQVFSDTINTGIYILEPEALDLIPYQQDFDFSKDLFPTMLEKKMPLYGYIAEGYWRDVGNLIEYQIGQYDALRGEVDLGFNINRTDDNQIEVGAQIAKSTKLIGKNIIGKNTVIGENCNIENSVISDNVVIGNGCSIKNTTIWRDVKIGDMVQLTDDVICNNVEIEDFVNVSENVFIAEHCKIGKSARLFSNIKLWPRKTVEEGASLFRSLVQEEKWNRELFTDARISGFSNIEINPEFGAKFGAALGMSFGKNSIVLASRDPDTVSRIIKRSITAGLLSVGVTVNDLQTISIPQTRQELRIGKYSGGLHVRKSPRNPEHTDIIIFSKDGRDITITITKKIERFFFGEDIERVKPSEVGEITFPERTQEFYINRYMKSLNKDLIIERKFKLLMDYSFGLASTIFPSILGKLHAEVISLNNYVDGSKFHPDPSESNSPIDDTGKIMRSLGYELGFRMQSGAEKIAIIDERGRWYSSVRLLSILAKLFLETHKNQEPYKIAVSIVAPREIEDIAKDYNVEVVRIKNNHSAMMESTLDESVKFVGGVYGGFIFPEFLFASDGMFTVGKMLEMLAQTGYTPSQLDELLPIRYQTILEVPVAWEFKGTVMRCAMEYSQNMEKQLVEGVKIFEGNNSAILLPAKEKASFLIYGEADTEEESKEIASKYADLINSWKIK